MKIELKRFYFTFGSDEQFPFHGGWVEVWAVDMHHAACLFKSKYPNRSECLNCADYYSEETFKSLKDFESGNLGAFCHDVIMPEGII